MSPELYQPAYLTAVSILALWVGGRRVSSPGYTFQDAGSGVLAPLVIGVLFSLWLGTRPINWRFGDTINYAMSYKLLDPGAYVVSYQGEWLWNWLMLACKGAGLGVSAFFTIVEFLYVMSALVAAKRIFPNDAMTGMLFIMSSLMFFTFGMNGIRNGLACHLVLLAASYLLDDRYVVGALLCLVALSIHKSTLLPIAALLAGMFVIKDCRYAIAFWFLSIGLSLAAGETITSFFASLGFDDRMTRYTTATNIDLNQFSKVGFRWDFLLYSSIPVLMLWYISVKREIRDGWYNALGTAYCLCNAFWIMVIRSPFSNRFAYLSWFLYPIVIAYPLINLPVWDDQDRKTGLIVMAYCGFTVFMLSFFWG